MSLFLGYAHDTLGAKLHYQSNIPVYRPSLQKSGAKRFGVRWPDTAFRKTLPSTHYPKSHTFPSTAIPPPKRRFTPHSKACGPCTVRDTLGAKLHYQSSIPLYRPSLQKSGAKRFGVRWPDTAFRKNPTIYPSPKIAHIPSIAHPPPKRRFTPHSKACGACTVHDTLGAKLHHRSSISLYRPSLRKSGAKRFGVRWPDTAFRKNPTIYPPPITHTLHMATMPMYSILLIVLVP